MVIVKLNISITIPLLMQIGGNVLLAPTPAAKSSVLGLVTVTALTLSMLRRRRASRPSSKCDFVISEANPCKRKRT